HGMVDDAAGNLWIGTENGELLQYHDGQFREFSQKDGLPSGSIRCLFRDSAGAVWMATTKHGLLLWDEQKFKHVGFDQGLPREAISQMIEDNAGRIWMGNQRGLYYVSREQLFSCALGKNPLIRPGFYGRNAGLVNYPHASYHQ